MTTTTTTREFIDCPKCNNRGFYFTRTKTSRPMLCSCAVCCRFGCDTDVKDYILRKCEKFTRKNYHLDLF